MPWSYTRFATVPAFALSNLSRALPNLFSSTFHFVHIAYIAVVVGVQNSMLCMCNNEKYCAPKFEAFLTFFRYFVNEKKKKKINILCRTV